MDDNWVHVADYYTYRLEVPGGWLYYRANKYTDIPGCMCFVPKPSEEPKYRPTKGYTFRD